MTHDQRRAEAARIRDDAEGRLAEIGKMKSDFITGLRIFGAISEMSDSDMQRFSDHLTDIHADLFADEIKELQTQIETASDLANQSNWDRSREYWEGK